MSSNISHLEPSKIGGVVKYGLCPRYTKLQFQSYDELKEKRQWKEAFGVNPVPPLLLKTGDEFEKSVYEIIEENAHDDSSLNGSHNNTNVDQFISKLNEISQRDNQTPSFFYQLKLGGNIGKFPVAGDADLVAVWPLEDHIKIRVFDIKASWKEKTYQQIQTAAYTTLLRKELKETSIDFKIEGGIIYYESVDEGFGDYEPSDFPKFELGPREDDLHRLLREDGYFDTVFEVPLEELDYRINQAARTSIFGETYFTKSIEEKHPRLLGLSRGEQKSLREKGITTIDDIAELTEPLENPRVYKLETPPIRDEYAETVQELEENYGFEERLSILSQKAQAMLGKLNPDHPDAFDKPWTPMIQGNGPPELPDDEPNGNWDIGFEKGSMIRVYMNVQHDQVRDRINMCSGRIDAGKYPNAPLSFSELIEEITYDKKEQDQQEKSLLETYAHRLFKAIKIVAEHSKNEKEAPVHFYFYTENEYQTLLETLSRYDSDILSSLRDLLSSKEGPEQPMVSIVQKQVENTVALKHPQTSIIPVVDSLRPYNDEKAELNRDDWRYKREDGTKVDLREAFKKEMFDYIVPFKREQDSIRLLYDTGESNDGFYPTLPRTTDAQIPLQYIWASKEIDEYGPDWIKEEDYFHESKVSEIKEQEDITKEKAEEKARKNAQREAARVKHVLESYMYTDRSMEERIVREDVQKMGEKLVQALNHIERSWKYKDTKLAQKKEEINIFNINKYTIGKSTLREACIDYLDLEYQASKSEAEELYKKSVKQRILTGKSVPIEIKNAEVNNRLLHAEGELLYDDFGFKNPERVAASCRYAGVSDDSGGKSVLATPLEKGSDGLTDSKSPSKIFHSPSVSISYLNPSTGEVKLIGYPTGYSKDDKYVSWHESFTTDESEKDEKFKTLFAEGEQFILDPNPDDLTSNRSRTALENASHNPLYKKISSFIQGHGVEKTDKFEEQYMSEFIDWLEENYSPTPNTHQKSFISEVEHTISLLQGPPGTGKTSGSLALAILGRIYSFEKQKTPLRGLVTGSSNKSVDEVLSDVSKSIKRYNSLKSDADPALNDILLVRLVGEEPENPLENVKYVNYHEHTNALEEIWARLQKQTDERQSSLNEHAGNGLPHIIVFSTPSRMYGLSGKIPPTEERVTAEEAYAMDRDLFDMLAIDEASMMPLPELFTTSAFTTPDAQVLVTGDHRQMPPVQKYEWKDEMRRTIRTTAPFLSTLDYFRFLRGDSVDILKENVEIESPEIEIPMARLHRTYRCHRDVAAFLQKWIYSKDNIDYTSDITQTISTPEYETEGLKTALSPENPLTVIIHDDDKSRQSNFTEARTASKIVKSIPETEDVGIVTPHNAQKGLLNSMCDAKIDTVERFQGGQKDVMIVSATVSDPDYIDAETDFIMNPNRLNVAISRMKKKLIVLVPKTLFETIPNDITQYNDATIWKGLYNEVDGDLSPNWSGSLSELTGESEEEKTNLEVHVKD